MTCQCKLVPITSGEFRGDSALVICEDCRAAHNRALDDLRCFGSGAVVIAGKSGALIEHCPVGDLPARALR